jgi:FtsP/CotA-like multicopper oxidase with cupredoxin domain
MLLNYCIHMDKRHISRWMACRTSPVREHTHLKHTHNTCTSSISAHSLLSSRSFFPLALTIYLNRMCALSVCVCMLAVPLKVNESFSSSFSVFGGTYFVHSHQDFNHDYGVTIPLIVKSATPSSYPMSASMIDNARDAVMFIEDFCPTTDDPVMFPNINTNCDNIKSVYDTLNTKWNAMSSTFNYNECQGGDMSGSTSSGSGSSTTSMPGMPGMSHSYRFRVSAPTMPMPMPMPMMMMGVKYKHYLINRRAPSAPSTFKAQVNEVIRLRIINGGSMMDYNITFPPSLSSSVTMISVDGHYIKPKQITSLWMAVGQRADVIITMPSTHDTIHTGVSTMHAQYMNVYLFVCVCVNMHVQVPLVCIQSLQPKKVIHPD